MTEHVSDVSSAPSEASRSGQSAAGERGGGLPGSSAPVCSRQSPPRRGAGPGMPPQSAPPQLLPAAPVGWLLGGAALVLAVVVSMVTLFSIDRSESAMARLLAEKGTSLIRAFESGLRTGMRSQVGVRLQSLLEEMSSSTDILFIAVTMPDGTIISHSSPDRLGEILQMDGREMDEAQMQALRPGHKAEWVVANMEGRRSFVVYRTFMPVKLENSRLPPPGVPQPLIFLGLDVSPFEMTRTQDRYHVLTLAGVILMVGMACLLALYYAQRARESRRRQHAAEGQVRLLEEEVRRKEKLAAVGTLAAGVAHEIRNPLSSIKGYATYFGQRFPDGSEDRQAAEVMVHEVDRLNRVITDLIGLSRPTDVHPEPVAARTVAEHALRLLRQDAERQGIALKLDAPAKLPDMLVDADRFGQALLNVCLNAIDAMPDGGALTIAVSRYSRKRLCLEVRDTGTGIAPEALAHIFEPYFTTKGHGTGLGLPTVHKIIEAHGGEVSVSSRLRTPERAGGTVFRFLLPIAAGGVS